MTRLLDLAVAIPLLIAALPATGLIALAVRLSGPGPLLHREDRLGQGGRPLAVPKFRTLRPAGGPAPRVAPAGDARETRVGAFLRRTHLDEIPQLFLVLGGRMRLVGPRPEPPSVWSGIDPGLRRRALAFPPGLTSPAGLRYLCEDAVLAGYRNPDRLYREVLLPRKLAEDLHYLEARSALGDLAIVLRSVATALGLVRDPDCPRRVRALLRGAGSNDNRTPRQASRP